MTRQALAGIGVARLSVADTAMTVDASLGRERRRRMRPMATFTSLSSVHDDLGRRRSVATLTVGRPHVGGRLECVAVGALRCAFGAGRVQRIGRLEVAALALLEHAESKVASF